MHSIAPDRAPGWLGLAACLLVAAAEAGTAAHGTTVTVTDRDGRPVPDVVVYSAPPDAAAGAAPAGTSAVMDQVDERFEPHILVVQTGTEVQFPNSDTVAHHVYSFSHPNHFKLPIYKGDAHPPVRFDEAGIVVLGCNIHDRMLGYIAVVDTPLFAKTDAGGVAVLDADLPAGSTVSIWSPRIRDADGRLELTVEAAAGAHAIAFRLEKALRPPHESESGVLSWSEY